MDFVSLTDIDGNPVELGNPDDAVAGVRRTTLAARLKALYGTVDKVDALRGHDLRAACPAFGSGTAPARHLEAAVRRAARRGPLLLPQRLGARAYRDRYGVSYKHTLAEIVELNTDSDVPDDVFHVAEE